MMLRYRRYRAFLLLAALSIFLLWRFSDPSSWEQSAHAVQSLTKQLGLKDGPVAAPPKPPQSPPSNDASTPVGNNKDTVKIPLPVIEEAPKPKQDAVPPPLGQKAPPAPKPDANIDSGPVKNTPGFKPSVVEDAAMPAHIAAEKPIAGGGVSRMEDGKLAPAAPAVHPIRWEKPVEHFPLTSTIQLPAGSPKPIPKIQAKFEAETAATKKDRLAKLAEIKGAMQHSWHGYKEHAWSKDELMPLSGDFKNPFNGWGATLIDSLDTLWMMGMKDDFEEAVEAVKDVDFQTSRRADIPVFETVIRFLGGLIGAYDVSGGQYDILLEKAVELAEVLIGAFDTPNRMPITFYHWRPTFTSQPHRAGNRVVLAELGSLSLEFTRLAQLTKQPRYYDAVARITDALDEWQDRTKIPGLWPLYVDAAGCAKVDSSVTSSPGKTQPQMIPLEKPPPLEVSVGAIVAEDPAFKPVVKPHGFDKRAITDAVADDSSHAVRKPTTVSAPKPGIGSLPVKALDAPAAPMLEMPECVPAGLDSYMNGPESFGLGSQADSTYEYLSKEFVLLGGLKDQYRKMYEKAMDAATETLMFRAMIPDENREILISGLYNHPMMETDESMYDKRNLGTGGSHLTCFVGGMYAMGSKLFNRPKDLELAHKLTDACVWAYESTATGIMQETFSVSACDEIDSCAWNETAWKLDIDPNFEFRQGTYERLMDTYNAQVVAQQAARKKLADQAAHAAEVEGDTSDSSMYNSDEGRNPDDDPFYRAPPLEKRSGAAMQAAQAAHAQISGQDTSASGPGAVKPTTGGLLYDTKDGIATPVSGSIKPSRLLTGSASIWSPPAPLTHEEYVADVLDDKNIAPGMLQHGDTRYILRPEALESVFYMHRITGDPYWRAAGWKMVSAILKTTKTKYGHSGIYNVNKADGNGWNDSMESFWLAETLKYAWLLFSDESEWSLDDWVLNTEAHPFRRPDVAPWDGVAPQKTM